MDFTNSTTIIEKLSRLRAGAKPVFGKMSPKQMVEHLIFVVHFSYGKNVQKLAVSKREAQKAKHFVIHTDKLLPKGVRFPRTGKESPDLQHPDIQEAVEALAKELEAFHDFFAKNKQATPVHPILGALNYREWIRFHIKHFVHHFKQFNLL